MIVKCESCMAEFDDEFRSTTCPHETFLANDGRNKHAHHERSYLSTDPKTDKSYSAPLYKSEQIELFPRHDYDGPAKLKLEGTPIPPKRYD